MEKEFLAHVVPHTHWDREWYFTFEEFRYRLGKMMSRLLDLMNDNTIEYFIADGHTLMIDDYLEVCPEREEEVRKLISEGRLLLGPWYTQPNVYMSDAEAQVRNLLRGKEEMLKYADTMEMASINYMPDMFGYHAQLPQMMKQFGMTHLIGARGMPNGCPNYFKWEGTDGTKVMVCCMPNSYNNGMALSDREEAIGIPALGDQVILPSLQTQLNVIFEDNDERKRAIAPQLLILNGVDHMWANPRMKETLAKISELYPDVTAVQSTFAKYIQSVEDTLTQEPALYQGELRDPRQILILPASQSTRMDVKKFNRRLEDKLEFQVEPLMACLQSLGEEELPFAFLKKAWEYMLTNQAHDSLCCAMPDPAYREVMTRFEKAEQITEEMHTELAQRLFRRMKGVTDEAVMIYNPLPHKRNETITFEITVADKEAYKNTQPHLYDAGTELPVFVQKVRKNTLLKYVPANGYTTEIPVLIYTVTANFENIPALGYKTYEIRYAKPHTKPVEGIVKGLTTLDNKYLTVEVNSDGTLDVTDKKTGKIYRQIHRFYDEGENGCGFMHIPPVGDAMFVSSGRDMDLEIVENNACQGIIRIRQTFRIPKSIAPDEQSRSTELAETKIVTDVILGKDSRSVEFETVIDNQAKDHRLRVAFPTDIDSDETYSGLPFDVITRPVQPENVNDIEPGSNEAYVGYHPMFDFCGITDQTTGAAVAGDGITEFEVLPMRRTVSITLIRAVDHLHVGAMRYGDKFKMNAAQMIGEHSYRYAFLPHDGGYEAVLDKVQEFRHPLCTVQRDFLEEESLADYKAPKQNLGLEHSFINIEGTVLFSALKPAEDQKGMILRVYNPLTAKTDAAIQLNDNNGGYSVEKVNLDETRIEEIETEQGRFSMSFEPKEIVSFRIYK